MAEREEIDLIQLYENSKLAEKLVDVSKLDIALRSGMESGRMKRRSSSLRRRWVIPAGALACCLLLILVLQIRGSIHSQDKDVLGSHMDIPDYVTSMFTPEMKEAADHGLYQPLNQTVTHGALKVTIDGVLADSRTMVVFYTSENLPANVPIHTNNASFVDAEGNYLEAGIQFSDPLKNPPGSPTNFEHGYYTLEFYNGHTPEQFTFSGKWGMGEQSDDKRVQFDIPVTLDSSLYADLEQTSEINQKASIGDHEITITEATIRPLSTEIQLQYNEVPNKKIQNYFAPQLNIKGQDGDRIIDSTGSTTSSVNGRALISSMYFRSLYYTSLDELTFQFSGIEESIGSNLKLVIDTEAKKLISVPDSSVQFVDVTAGKDSTELQLKVFRDSEYGSSLYLSYEFTDADGMTHTFQAGRSGIGFAGDDFETITYRLKQESYPQPLTFDITTYPGKIIKENVSIKLK
ncbi:DUF4179 domain-containing protein [Paenibacillus anaericanus]|uniref:DUF4179 domain-containing protein n=1 Tax=Paenibacillus anaericanus TaxID=170367 RepID=A0A3S1K5X1_9BACL|nr:DUF4179 domain-containing protein [Paenibacillus anaericanus]RUT44560.1 DUF4179 domain-containing protein [Paenibacillus anaericanus]